MNITHSEPLTVTIKAERVDIPIQPPAVSVIVQTGAWYWRIELDPTPQQTARATVCSARGEPRVFRGGLIVSVRRYGYGLWGLPASAAFVHEDSVRYRLEVGYQQLRASS